MLSGLSKDGASVEAHIFSNVVSSMQEVYSLVISELASHLLPETDSRNLIVTGGCALSILANTRLVALADNVCFQPNSGDRSLSLRAVSAAAEFLEKFPLYHPEIPVSVRRNPYMGLSLQDSDQ